MPMRISRTTKVVVSITLVSTVVGGLAGITAAAILALKFAGRSALLEPELYAVAGGIGALCGAVLGPAAAFGFMRRVPLGRLFVGTAAGAIAGGVSGFLLFGFGLASTVGTAAIGFTAAAAGLSWRYRQAREPAALPPTE